MCIQRPWDASISGGAARPPTARRWLRLGELRVIGAPALAHADTLASARVSARWASSS
jgi:hypothetical protein